MFTRSAHLYDAIHGPHHDYANEVRTLRQLVERSGHGAATTLLDVACGTGALLPHLRRYYQVEGLDLEPTMLAIARERNPDLPLHQADLADFDLGRRFDVILCLGSSIGYVRTVPRLRQAIRTIARHLTAGGVLLVEPWFTPAVWEDGRQSIDLTIARLLVSGRDGDLSTLDIHYLVGSPAGVDYFVERHEMGLFTDGDYRDAIRAAGLEVQYDSAGLIGRGMYIGVRTGSP